MSPAVLDAGGAAAPPVTLDLSSHGVLGHFARSTRNPRLLTFLMALDRVDRWAVDFDEAESPSSIEIQMFLRDLERFVESSLPVLHRVPTEFGDMLAHLTSSRCLYLVQKVSEHGEGFFDALSLLLQGEDGASAGISTVKRRLDAFSRAKLLGEIFSHGRLTRIMKIMGSYSDVH